ncbi:MAG: ferredoxin [Candidatus Heimdallarchaeota archaeon]
MAKKEPRVNKHECCGCALCTYALPEVFRLTPEGVAEVYAPHSAERQRIQKVMDDCPMGCVHWFEKIRQGKEKNA